MAFFYAQLMSVLSWFSTLILRYRKSKEDSHRHHERLGRPQLPRPEGILLWVHGASVGETLSALPLVEHLLNRNENLSILVTSGTRTSAELLAKRLPPRAFHQYIPLDVPYMAKGFLQHWQPQAVIWLESDLWPNMLLAVRKRRIPAILLNARLSEKSAQRWQRLAPKWISSILATFSLTLGQTEAEVTRLSALGHPNSISKGNLKYTAPAPSWNKKDLALLKQSIGQRALWLMGPTQPGEEALAANVHERVKKQYPTLLTIIMPRHPTRGNEIATQLKARGLQLAQRSIKEEIAPNTDIYLADTLGEAGTLYRTAPIVCIGGSFVDKRGHSPIEAAQCGTALLYGPDSRNIISVVNDLKKAGALHQVANETELALSLGELLQDEKRRSSMQEAALRTTARQEEVLRSILTAIAPILERADIKV